MGSVLNEYNGLITEFIYMLICIMAVWFFSCTSILNNMVLVVFCQTVFSISLVFFIRFLISNVRSKAQSMLLQLAHMDFWYKDTLIYIYRHQYIPFFWCFLAIFGQFSKIQKSEKNTSRYFENTPLTEISHYFDNF